MYEKYPEKYITSQGETWETISMDFYGTPFKVSDLIKCNPQHSNVLVFEGNIALDIPILQEDKAESLAPWKRGV